MISFAFFVSVVVEILLSHLKNIKNMGTTEAGTILFSFLFISVFLISDVLISIKYLYGNTTKQTPVTQDDIDVFNWISLNTTGDQVIANNYGDSGIWIPAYASRKITNYDATLFDLDKFRTGIKKYQADFIFIGTKVVYPNSIQYKYDDIKPNANYQEIYHSGGAHLFKITKP
ncbi:MAG TPA: hypothetical protein VI230_02205 [Ignavibacteriaceae bacterium]